MFEDLMPWGKAFCYDEPDALTPRLSTKSSAAPIRFNFVSSSCARPQFWVIFGPLSSLLLPRATVWAENENFFPGKCHVCMWTRERESSKMLSIFLTSKNPPIKLLSPKTRRDKSQKMLPEKERQTERNHFRKVFFPAANPLHWSKYKKIEDFGMN